MSRFSHLLRGAIGLGAIAAIVSCGDADSKVLGPVDPTGGALFKTYVSIGNSITAGYQSGGINDSTQRQSYAVLLAKQMSTRFAIPSLRAPGCPPPVAREATEALAVHHEHRDRDLEAAKAFALQSLEVDAQPAWTRAVQHRLARLDRKLKLSGQSSSLLS